MNAVESALRGIAGDLDHRPGDAADLRTPLAVADAEELRLAGEAVGLIEERGCQRDRDLVGALAELRRS